MSLDITPAVPAGRQLIQSYGDGGFRIGGEAVQGSLLVFTEETRAWPVTAPDDISLETLADIVATSPGILVIGCGARFVAPPKGLRDGLKAHGVALEWMDTGAACRTFNVLLAEDRGAAAALIAVE
ncbi:MAG: hypothetical protein HOH04_16755 [Rhodospirillaceae bacterium]|nr:hypothetical protein [Rhodospirillaceae bacterium]